MQVQEIRNHADSGEQQDAVDLPYRRGTSTAWCKGLPRMWSFPGILPGLAGTPTVDARGKSKGPDSGDLFETCKNRTTRHSAGNRTP